MAKGRASRCASAGVVLVMAQEAPTQVPTQLRLVK